MADRTLLSLAPLIYVAWSDGTLTDAEINRIRARLSRQSPEVHQILEDWLNPAIPPTPSQLYSLLEMMRSAGAGAHKKRFQTLSEFGRFLARNSKSNDDATPELLALQEVEAALGVVGPEALRTILGTAGPHHATGGAGAPDVGELRAFVDGERADIHRLIFKVLERAEFDRSTIEDLHDYRERVYEWCRALANHGVSAYGYPVAYDGEDNVPKAIAAFETLAFFDLSLLVKFGVQFGLFGGSVLQLGTRKHHDTYLRAIGALELPGCFAMTETGHGSNVRDIETTASYDIGTQEFIIHTPTRSAWKDYIGNAAVHGRMATVFAQLEVNGEQHGVHAFLVPLRDEQGNVLPGVTIEDDGRKIGLNGVDNGRIAFKSVRIPRDNLLNRFADVSADGKYTSPIPSASRRFFTMLGTLVAGRVSIAAASCSSAKLGLAICTHYAIKRKQFGPEGSEEVSIISYRTVQRKLLPLIARTYALDFAIHDTVRLFKEPDPDSKNLEMQAAALKALASRHAVDTLEFARELCGGLGYMWDTRIGELRADTDIFTTFEGANTVLLQLVAKGLLTELKEQFEEMRIWAAVRQVTARASTAVAELNPVITRKTDVEHLRDPAFHGNALRFREARLLHSVAARLRALINDGMDSFEAVNECQDHLVKLAEAYAERLVLESFHERIAHFHDGGTHASMNELCALYALSCIENDRGWFLESGYIEPGKSKAIRRVLNDSCTRLAEWAEVFIDGWSIPDRFLPASVLTT
ncbi:MAG TPA: acyl-CoA dehydrogenase [Longimicrobiales bacterium]